MTLSQQGRQILFLRFKNLQECCQWAPEDRAESGQKKCEYQQLATLTSIHLFLEPDYWFLQIPGGLDESSLFLSFMVSVFLLSQRKQDVKA